jgi:proline iminopeptidase
VTTVAGRYPAIEPYEHGLLDVGDGHRIYWETCGNPKGKPALVLHGGPGSGCSATIREFFDPARYRVVLFDQRACGRSLPHASEAEIDLSAVTTDHFLADIERLREFLGIDRWLLFGASWGSVLGLTYAQRFPHRVSEIVFFGVATGSVAEVDLLTRGLGNYFPRAWAAFRDGVPEEDRDGSLPAGYHKLLMSLDPEVRERAAKNWTDWESAIEPTSPPSPRYQDPKFRMAFTRMVTHFWSNDHFLGDMNLVEEAGKLAGIPGVLVQGTLDPGNLLGTVWRLQHNWPGCELIMIDEAGHSNSNRMTEELIAALDRFANR